MELHMPNEEHANLLAKHHRERRVSDTQVPWQELSQALTR